MRFSDVLKVYVFIFILNVHLSHLESLVVFDNVQTADHHVFVVAVFKFQMTAKRFRVFNIK